MMRKNFFTAGLVCGILLAAVLFGCSSQPEPKPDPVIEDDVWTLLAQGETEKARAFFMGDVDVNARDGQNRTPLHIVAENKDSVMAAFFLALGADPNALDSQDRIPLDISAEKRDPPTAKILAAGGSNIHHAPGGGTSPARAGINEGGDFLTALINPATLESADSNGKTLLHLSAEAGNAAAAEQILAAGKIDLARRDKSGKTALDLALERTDDKRFAETAEKIILAGAVSQNPLYAYFAPAVKSSNFNIRSADGMAPLHYLAREGYTGYIDFTLERNADVNIKNASGATPLHEAARSGNIRVMRALIERGAEIRTQDAKGNSVLHIAVPPETHLEAAELFLEHGADPSVRDEHGDSPLHIAIVLNRQPELAAALLQAGSDVSIRNVDGKTPLYLAVEEGRINYIPQLLSYKSDIFAADNNGISPFEKALMSGGPILYTMITEETVFANDSQGNTVLHIAARNGADTEVVSYILDRGARVNARNKEGDTALHLAVRMNREEAGGLLLARDADIFAPNAAGQSPLFISFPAPGRSATELRRWMHNPQTLQARDGLGNTALHYLAQWRYDLWIPFAITHGAATEASNATGETPLFVAVKFNSPSTIMVLVANGANRDARDTLGNSALHAAVRWNAPKSAETLLVIGLDINAHALNGKTPLHDAVRLGMTEIEGILLAHNAALEIRDTEGSTPFMEAVLAGSAGSMRRLVDKGADSDTRNFRGDTPLHLAALINRGDISAMLLSWGASIHARNSAGRTPFHNALHVSPAAVRTMLTRERVNRTDDYGNSPLHIAIQERCSYATIRTILDLGARTGDLDSEGRIPLRLAIDNNDWETAKLLADTGSDVFIAARDGKCSAELALKDTATVQALFSGRAIGTKDNFGNTVLHYAAKDGNPAIIQQLLDLGANKNVRNIASESPADIAVRWKKTEAAALLY